MALTQFRAKLKEYLREAGYSHKQLAYELGMHPAQLSNKLNEHNYANLTLSEVKQVIKVLAEWQALNTTQEALELLALGGLSPNSFSQTEWASPPLNFLTKTSQAPVLPSKGQAFGPQAKTTPASLKPIGFPLTHSSPTLQSVTNGPLQPLTAVTTMLRREEG